MVVILCSGGLQALQRFGSLTLLSARVSDRYSPRLRANTIPNGAHKMWCLLALLGLKHEWFRVDSMGGYGCSSCGGDIETSKVFGVES